MRICATVLGFVVLLVTIVAAIAGDAPAEKNTAKKFRFFLQINETQDHLVAVPALANEKPPENATVVTCDSLRFEKNAIVFVNVTMDSKENCLVAAEMTPQLDSISGSDVSWNASDDFTMKFKSTEAQQRFLNSHTH